MPRFYNPKFDWLFKCMNDFWVAPLTFFLGFALQQSSFCPLSASSNSSPQLVTVPAGIDYYDWGMLLFFSLWERKWGALGREWRKKQVFRAVVILLSRVCFFLGYRIHSFWSCWVDNREVVKRRGGRFEMEAEYES